MPADINTYAIDINFQLNTTAATAGLKSVQNYAQQVEDQIRKVGALLGVQLRVMAADFNTGLSAILNTTKSLSAEWKRLMPDFTETSRLFKDNVGQQLQFNKEFEKTQAGWEKIRDVRKEIANLDDGAADAGKTALQQAADQTKAQIASKTGTVQLSALSSVLGAKVGEVGAAWGRTSGSIAGAAVKLAGFFFGVQAVVGAFRALMDEETLFNTVNYRWYGSQRDILTSVNDTTIAYGLLRGKAKEAFVALLPLYRISAANVADLAQKVTKFNQATGVSINATADWTRHLTFLGIAQRDVERTMAHVIGAQQASGMTSQQVGDLLQWQTQNAGQLRFAFGKLAPDVEKMQAEFVALGQAVSGPTGATAWKDFTAIMATNQDAMTSATTVSGGLTDQFQSMAPITRQFAGAAAGVSRMLNLLGPAARDSSGAIDVFSNQARKAILGLGQQYGMSETQAANFYSTAEDLIEQYMKETGQATRTEQTFSDAFAWKYKVMADEIKKAADLNKAYNESSQGLADTWTKVCSTFRSGWQNLLIAAAPVLDLLLLGLLKLGELFGWAMSKIADGVKIVTEWGSAVKTALGFTTDTTTAVRNTTTAATNWLDSIGKVSMAIGVLAATILGLIFVVKGLKLLGGAIFNLRRIMNTLKPGPIITLSIAMLAFGAAVLMVSYGIAMLAKQPIGGLIVAFLGIALVFGILAVALYFLTPILAPFAVALILVGVAALLVAAAVWILAKAFEIVIGVVMQLYNEVGGVKLIGMGLAMVVFGVLVIAAAVLIGIGGALLALASVALAAGLYALSWAIWFISDDDIAKLGRLGKALQAFGAAAASLRGLASGVSVVNQQLEGVKSLLKTSAEQFTVSSDKIAASASVASFGLLKLRLALTWLSTAGLGDFGKDLSRMADGVSRLGSPAIGVAAKNLTAIRIALEQYDIVKMWLVSRGLALIGETLQKLSQQNKIIIDLGSPAAMRTMSESWRDVGKLAADSGEATKTSLQTITVSWQAAEKPISQAATTITAGTRSVASALSATSKEAQNLSTITTKTIGELATLGGRVTTYLNDLGTAARGTVAASRQVADAVTGVTTTIGSQDPVPVLRARLLACVTELNTFATQAKQVLQNIGNISATETARTDALLKGLTPQLEALKLLADKSAALSAQAAAALADVTAFSTKLATSGMQAQESIAKLVATIGNLGGSIVAVGSQAQEAVTKLIVTMSSLSGGPFNALKTYLEQCLGELRSFVTQAQQLQQQAIATATTGARSLNAQLETSFAQLNNIRRVAEQQGLSTQTVAELAKRDTKPVVAEGMAHAEVGRSRESEAAQLDMVRELKSHTDLLTRLIAVISKPAVTASEGESLEEIKKLLADHLPGMANPGSRLASQSAGWPI